MTLSEFQNQYFLKSELIHLCGKLGLSSSGSKEVLTQKIMAHLSGVSPNIESRVESYIRPLMPENLTLETRVKPGFKLNTQLREFFILKKAVGCQF